MRLQASLSTHIRSLGDIPFNTYRSFKNSEMENEEPFRFVDGELIERFLDLETGKQEEICGALGVGVEDVRGVVEELRRVH
jgi:DNA damage-binding protein 1